MQDDYDDSFLFNQESVESDDYDDSFLFDESETSAVNSTDGAVEQEVLAVEEVVPAENQLDPKELPHADDINAASNIARGAGERATSLMGDLAGFAATTGQNLENEYQLGGLVWEKDEILPSYLDGKEYKSWQDSKKGVTSNILRAGQEALKGVDLDYEPRSTWEGVKESESAWDLATNVATFSIEQGLVSVPDMVAMVATLPSYLMARTEEIAQERAASNGRSEPTPQDVAIGASASLAVTALDRFGLEKMLAPLKGVTGSAVKKIGVATATEGVTEGIQEGIEYSAERLGTEKGANIDEALDRMAGGAVGGAGFGGAASTVGSAVDKLSGRGNIQDKAQNKGRIFDQQTNDQPFTPNT